jgi:hypothetical protein
LARTPLSLSGSGRHWASAGLYFGRWKINHNVSYKEKAAPHSPSLNTFSF